MHFLLKLSRFKDMLIFGGVNLIKFSYTNLIFRLLTVNLAVLWQIGQDSDDANKREGKLASFTWQTVFGIIDIDLISICT